MKEILAELKALRRKADGDVYDPDLKKIAKAVGTDHELAIRLWDTGYDAARELAIHLADPGKATEKLLEQWVGDLDEWGLCDGFTARLVRNTSFAVEKAREWAGREPEYERRAGFSLMAQMAWQKNAHPDKVFAAFLPIVEKYATDDRYYVKKAVNWALRDIGKRNGVLKEKALAVSQRLRAHPDKTARWVGTHRMKEVAG